MHSSLECDSPDTRRNGGYFGIIMTPRPPLCVILTGIVILTSLLVLLQALGPEVIGTGITFDS